jgi:enamine deaminase RidA (YjgF/YER057c/UK114 family)
VIRGAYLCGQIGGCEGDIVKQTKECLNRVETLLQQAGSGTDKILQAIIWLADMQNFDAMNEIRDAWVDQGTAPARACDEAKLAHPNLKIDIIITAAL